MTQQRARRPAKPRALPNRAPTVRQVQATDVFTLTFTAADLAVLNEAVGLMPYARVVGLVQTVNAQLAQLNVAQQAPADDAADDVNAS